MARRLFPFGTVVSGLLLLSGCGTGMDEDSGLLRAYLGKMGDVTLTPRGTLAPEAGNPAGNHDVSIRDGSGQPVDDLRQLLLAALGNLPSEVALEFPSVQVDMDPSPEGSSHLFTVRSTILGKRRFALGENLRASLDLRLVPKEIGITDIFRYIGIDEHAVLEDLRLQLEQELNQLFLARFRLLVSFPPESLAAPLALAPKRVSFNCSFQKAAFHDGAFDQPPLTCRADLAMDRPFQELHFTLEGP